MNISDSLSIASMHDQIENINTQLSDLHNLISHSNDAIANEIAAGDRFLTYVGLILGFVGILLGFYITWCYQKVRKMKISIERKERDVKDLSNKVEKINEQIQNDISGLYEKLRKEESKSLLNRLIKVPEDIDNIVDLLLARELLPEDFSLLKQAFENLPKDNEDNVKKYLLLFFQHFAGQSIKYNDLRNRFVADFALLVSVAFKNDIEKSTKDIVLSLEEAKDEIKIQVLTPYCKALKKSKYKDMDILFTDIKSIVTNEQWQNISKTEDEMSVEEDK